MTAISSLLQGFSNIRELQLLRETGMHTLEVLKSATLNSAKTLRQNNLGLVRPGYTADLIIINESPLFNLRNMYSFGSLTTESSGEMVRKGGIIHTIKDGIVIENAKLMDEVERMVKQSKTNAKPTAMEVPFVIDK
jgi:imidazolonepropionase-like amidohydrolase